MELETEKFIESARTDDRTHLRSFLGDEVFHQVFGHGKIVGVEMRDAEDGPIFRVQFDDSVREFNLDSFSEGYIDKGTPSRNRGLTEECSVNPVAEIRAAEAC